MKLIDRIRVAVKAFTGGAGIDTVSSWGHPYANGFWACWPDQNPYVPLNAPCDLTLSSIVMACVNWTGTTLPSAPLQVQVQKDIKVWETIPDHPLVSLIEDPNPFFSGITYWKAFAYWWLVYGNVYIYKARNDAGAVVELWMLDSRAVIPEWTETQDGRDIIYRYSGTGLPAAIPPDDMIHFRYGMDPNLHLQGMPPVRSLLNEIATDQEINSYTTAIMRNFGVPSFIVSPKPTNDGIYNINAKELDDDIRSRTAGAFRGKPLIFNKPMELGTFGFSPDQMAVEKASRRPESRVCAVLGIPAIVLGFEVGLERSIYNNLRAAQEQAWMNYIIPTQDYIVEVLEDQLLYETIVTEEGTWNGADSEGYRIIFDRSAVAALQPDRNELFTREVNAYKSGVKKRSEVRSALGLDSTPEDEVYFVQPLAPGAVPGPFGAKQLGLLPSPSDEQEIAAWWDEVAPPAARGLLNAEQIT